MTIVPCMSVQEFAAPPDQAPAGKPEFQPHAPIAVVMHVGHLSLAGPSFITTTPTKFSGTSIVSRSIGSVS